ncbi:MAG: rhodanese-like domain-containing protein [Candidatus Peregrinibacteria bacterium]|nr:rhodanese-like domain-containing protein [Candidatus Peregrinibacteria bacterium]
MITEISPKELQAKLNNKEALILIDVREPSELHMSGIIQGGISLPLGDLTEERVLKHVTDKSNPLVLICRSGGRSSYAGHFLDKWGFKNIFNLSGGVDAWRSAGFNLVPWK